MPLADGKEQTGRVGHPSHTSELQQRNNSGHMPSFLGMRPCGPLELPSAIAQANLMANHLASQPGQSAANYMQSIAQVAQSALQAGLLGSHSAQPIGMPWLPLTVPALSMPMHHPVSYLPFHPGSPPSALSPPPYFMSSQALNAAASAALGTGTGAGTGGNQPYGAFNLPTAPPVLMLNQYLQYLFAAQHLANQAHTPLSLGNSSPLGSASSSVAPSQLSPRSTCATQSVPTNGAKQTSAVPLSSVSAFADTPTPAPTPSTAVFMPSFAFSHKPSGSVIPVGIAAQVRPSAPVPPLTPTAGQPAPLNLTMPVAPTVVPSVSPPPNASVSFAVPDSSNSAPSSSAVLLPANPQSSCATTITDTTPPTDCLSAAQSVSTTVTNAAVNDCTTASQQSEASAAELLNKGSTQSIADELVCAAKEERSSKKGDRSGASTCRKVLTVPPVAVSPKIESQSTETAVATIELRQDAVDDQDMSDSDATAESNDQSDSQRTRRRQRTRTKRPRFGPTRRLNRRKSPPPSEDQPQSASSQVASLEQLAEAAHQVAKQRKRERQHDRKREKTTVRRRDKSEDACTENNNTKSLDEQLSAVPASCPPEASSPVILDPDARRFLIEENELASCDNLPVLHYDAENNTYVEVRISEMVPCNLYEMRVLGDRRTQQHILTHEEVLSNCVHDFRMDFTASAANQTSLEPLALEQMLTAQYANVRIAARWHYSENRFYAGQVRRVTAKRGRLPNTHAMEVEVEFDDGDTGVIDPDHVRLIPALQPSLLRAAAPPPRPDPLKDSRSARGTLDQSNDPLLLNSNSSEQVCVKLEPAEKRRRVAKASTSDKEDVQACTNTSDIAVKHTKRRRTKIAESQKQSDSDDEPRSTYSKTKTEAASHQRSSRKQHSERRMTRQRKVGLTTSKQSTAPEGGKSNSTTRASRRSPLSATAVPAHRASEFLRVGDCVQFHTDSASALSLSGRRRRAPPSAAGASSQLLPFIGRIVAIYAVKPSETDDNGSRSACITASLAASESALFGTDNSACTSSGLPLPSVSKIRKVSVRRAPLPAYPTSGLSPQTDELRKSPDSPNACSSATTGETQASSGFEVHVRWFYHPKEVAIPVQASICGNSHALFESNHRDRNDLATISHRVTVRSYTDFVSAKPDVTNVSDSYFVAGYYDPIKHILAYADDVRERLIKS